VLQCDKKNQHSAYSLLDIDIIINDDNIVIISKSKNWCQSSTVSCSVHW